MLSRYGHLEQIPADPADWDITLRGAAKLGTTLREQMDSALLFRRIATVVLEAPVSTSVDELRWTGPADPAEFARLCAHLDAPALPSRAEKLAARRTE